MKNVNVSNFRKNLFEILNETIEYNEPVNVSTKNGNAVVMSEEEYNSIMETVYIMGNKATYEQILQGKDAPIEEFEPFEW